MALVGVFCGVGWEFGGLYWDFALSVFDGAAAAESWFVFIMRFWLLWKVLMWFSDM